MNTAPRRALLLAALAAVRVKTQAPEFAILHAWLDSWSGLARIVPAMPPNATDLPLPHERNARRPPFPPRTHALYPGAGQRRARRPTPGPATPAAACRA